MNSLVSSLFKNGHYISYLLSKSKTKDDSNDNFDNLIDEVIESTKQVLNSLENHSQHPDDTFPREDVFPKVLDKIKTTLEFFQKLNTTNPDAASKFKEVEERIDKCRNDVKQKSSKNVDGAESDTVDDPFKFLWDDHDHHLENDSSSLDEKQKECLLFCSELLKYKNQNQNRDMVRISRRKLIHWWIGLGSIDGPTEGKEVLEKLVEEGFIIPNADIPRLSNISKGKGYIIHAKNLPNEKSKANESPKQDASSDDKKRRVGSPFVFKKWPPKDKIPVAVVINIDTYTLNENTLKNFMKTDVVILNLGTWSYNPTKKVKSTKYVVIEDIDALESFLGHSWPSLRMLSFQGIGGIVTLPESAYNISSLKVLDLKACPNLEILPPGINSLSQLTHLDLSECYLLDHIPKGLASLTNLQVLKGFIINYNINSNKECAFEDLAKLTGLIKLAVRARTTNFPTISNVKTINEMTQLKYLKVVWVQSINSYGNKIDPKKIGTNNFENNSEGKKSHDSAVVLKLPETLEKLELQAASEINATQMLDLISFKSGYCPKKLYIRGGDLWKLDPYAYCFTEVETLRFRYLPKLHMKWSDCQSMFPKLSHLEVLECPNLVCFPCDDNGMWNKLDQS